MSERVESWSIPGSDDEAIFGDTHFPQTDDHRRSLRGIMIIAHGFKGYKDYGMFPRIASECARSGLIAHRFNFSHSGMTNTIDTFERPDLFEKDTWNKQVFDLSNVVEYATADEHSGAGSRRGPGSRPLPLFLLGHSRGGVTVLLTLGRHADEPGFRRVAGAITLAAPSYTIPFTPEEDGRLLVQGYLDSPSSRTGQNLRIGKAFLQEQLDDAEGHDLLPLVANIRCPVLLIHGENDPTVPVSCADELADAIGTNARVVIVPGGDHVFNTPNPMPPESQASPQLAAVLSAVIDFTSAATRSDP